MQDSAHFNVAPADTAGVPPRREGYSRRESWSVLGAMIAVSATLSLVVLPFSQVVDPVRKTFGIDDVAFSLLVGVFFAVPSMLMSVVGGWLADRSPRRRLLIVATLLWTAGAVWTALAPSYEQLALARIVVAIGAGIKFPLAMTWINDAFPPALRARAIGAFFVVVGLGPALGASLGGLVLQAAEAGRLANWPGLAALEPWRAALLLLALCNLLFLPWVASLRDVRPAPAEGAGAADAGPSTAPLPLGLLGAMIAGCAFLVLGDTANLTWLPTVLRRQHGFDAQQTGFAFGIIATMAGALGPLVGGVAGDAAYRRRGTAGRLWLCAAAALLCTPLLAAYGANDARWLIAALVGNGMLSVMALTLGYVAVQGLLPPGRRGLGTGLTGAATQLLAAAAPTIVAFVSARLPAGPGALGTAVGIVTVSSFAAAAAVSAWTAWRVSRWSATQAVSP